MNQFYHEFIVGFNWWYVVAPIGVAIMAMFGAQSFKLDSESLRIHKTRGKNTGMVLSIILSALIAIMIATESGNGIIQYFYNGELSPTESLVAMSLSVGVAAFFYGCLLFLIAKVAAWAKLGYLSEKRRLLARSRKAHR